MSELKKHASTQLQRCARPQAHSEECRRRIEERMATGTEEERRRLQESEERMTRAIAEEVE